MTLDISGISPLMTPRGASPIPVTAPAEDPCPLQGESVELTGCHDMPMETDRITAGRGNEVRSATPEESPKPNRIRDLLSQYQDRVLPMEWKKEPPGGTAAPLPCDGNEVMKAFRERRGVLCGRPGFFSKQVRMVEIEQPKTLGDAANLLVAMARREMDGAGREYGLMLYCNDRGQTKYMVERGTSWLWAPDIHQYRVIETPDREQWLLAGCLGHTHPNRGEGNPSAGDHDAMKRTIPDFRQRFSIVAAEKGWHLFDAHGTYEPAPQALSLPVTSLFD